MNKEDDDKDTKRGRDNYIYIYIYICLGWDKMKSNKQGKPNQMGWKIFYHPYMYLSSMDPI